MVDENAKKIQSVYTFFGWRLAYAIYFEKPVEEEVWRAFPDVRAILDVTIFPRAIRVAQILQIATS